MTSAPDGTASRAAVRGIQHNGEIFPHQAPQAASAHGVIHRSAAVKAAGQGTGTVWRDPPQAESFHRKVQRRRCLSGRAGSRRQGGGCGGRGWHGGGRSARLRRTRGQNKAQRQRGGTDMFFHRSSSLRGCFPDMSGSVCCIQYRRFLYPRCNESSGNQKNGCRKMPFKSTLRQPFSLAAEPYFSRSPP